MKKSQTPIIIVLVLILIVIFAVVHSYRASAPGVLDNSGTSGKLPIATASYACDSGKTIAASFYQGESKPAASPDMPPIPGGSVAIKLSDGRSMTLAQTISADGIRYANSDESFVFWEKGNGALVLENNQQQTYMGCVKVVTDPGSLPQVYQNGTDGLSMRYPSGYTVDSSYVYQLLGPGKDIHGVKFTIPESMKTGTNLSSDSYISVEEIPQTTSCSASLFLADAVPAKSVTDNGVTYSYGTTSDAGAGNRYEETVYAIPGTNPCVAVRYLVHYTAVEDYPAGSIKAFDKQALIDQFDSIRRTLIINQ